MSICFLECCFYVIINIYETRHKKLPKSDPVFIRKYWVSCKVWWVFAWTKDGISFAAFTRSIIVRSSGKYSLGVFPPVRLNTSWSYETVSWDIPILTVEEFLSEDKWRYLFGNLPETIHPHIANAFYVFNKSSHNQRHFILWFYERNRCDTHISTSRYPLQFHWSSN
jgi:hypothetical protein